jgi:hypothetical protein
MSSKTKTEGPGIVYLGIHGGQFLELSKIFFGREFFSNTNSDSYEEELTPLAHSSDAASDNSGSSETTHSDDGDGRLCKALKVMLWCVSGMPIWTWLASIGKGSLTNYVTEMALKSPHPIRIGNVRFARAKVLGGDSYTRVVMLQRNNHPSTRKKNLSVAFANAAALSEDPEDSTTIDDVDQRFDSLSTRLLRADSLPKLSRDSYKMQTMNDGTIVALPPLAFYQPKQNSKITNVKDNNTNNPTKDYQSINQKIGAMAKAAAANHQQSTECDDIAIEDDPQGDPPKPLDFAIAIFYIIFGIIAMFAGLVSIF